MYAHEKWLKQCNKWLALLYLWEKDFVSWELPGQMKKALVCIAWGKLCTLRKSLVCFFLDVLLQTDQNSLFYWQENFVCLCWKFPPNSRDTESRTKRKRRERTTHFQMWTLDCKRFMVVCAPWMSVLGVWCIHCGWTLLSFFCFNAISEIFFSFIWKRNKDTNT